MGAENEYGGKSMMGKTCIILGTRPEIIKMSPVVRACERQEGSDWFVLHTGQHYSYGMDRVFFEQLGLPDAKYNLDVGSGSGMHGEQTGRMDEGSRFKGELNAHKRTHPPRRITKSGVQRISETEG